MSPSLVLAGSAIGISRRYGAARVDASANLTEGVWGPLQWRWPRPTTSAVIALLGWVLGYGVCEGLKRTELLPGAPAHHRTRQATRTQQRLYPQRRRGGGSGVVGRGHPCSGGASLGVSDLRSHRHARNPGLLFHLASRGRFSRRGFVRVVRRRPAALAVRTRPVGCVSLRSALLLRRELHSHPARYRQYHQLQR